MRRRRGIAYTRQEVGVQLPWFRFDASWQPKPDDPDTFEDGPGWSDLEEAILWARKRAPRVHVRLSRGHFGAGEHDWPGVDPRWPGAKRRRERGVHDRYGGVAYVNEQRPWWWPRDRYSATWESDSGAVLSERSVSPGDRGGFRDLETAIDWGKARAPVVLVALLSTPSDFPPSYEIWSAGDEDPSGEKFPRLRPLPPDETMAWVYSNTIADPDDLPFEEVDIEGSPSVRSKRPEDVLVALRRDPRAIDPVVEREEREVRFVVRAANLTEAHDLAEQVFRDATFLLPEGEGEYLWTHWVGDIRPVSAGSQAGVT